MTLEEKLIARLADAIGQAAAVALVGELVQAGTAETVLALLDELQQASSKVAQAAVEALPELRRRGGFDVVVSWLDLGVALAGSSGAAAM
ncbi:MAG: hypothetical protein AAB093_04905, partial [Nitrospirota bacterium]